MKIQTYKLDLCVGIALILASIGLNMINWWLWVGSLMIGMNLAMGNLRYFYNKKLKRPQDQTRP